MTTDDAQRDKLISVINKNRQKLIDWIDQNHDVLTRSEFALRLDVVIAGIVASQPLHLQKYILTDQLYLIADEQLQKLNYENNTI